MTGYRTRHVRWGGGRGETAGARSGFDWVAIEGSREFREPAARRRRFIVRATIFFLAFFLTYLLLTAFAAPARPRRCPARPLAPRPPRSPRARPSCRWPAAVQLVAGDLAGQRVAAAARPAERDGVEVRGHAPGRSLAAAGPARDEPLRPGASACSLTAKPAASGRAPIRLAASASLPGGLIVSSGPATRSRRTRPTSAARSPTSRCPPRRSSRSGALVRAVSG